MNGVTVTLSHKATAWVQAALSVVFIVAYFIILLLFMEGHVEVPAEFKDAFEALLGLLTANVGLIMTFWFARQRTSADAPKPTTPTP